MWGVLSTNISRKRKGEKEMTKTETDEIMATVKFICGLADEGADTDYVGLLQGLSKKIASASKYDMPQECWTRPVSAGVITGFVDFPKQKLSDKNIDLLIETVCKGARK